MLWVLSRNASVELFLISIQNVRFQQRPILITTHNVCFHGEIRKNTIYLVVKHVSSTAQGPVVQRIVTLTSSLMTNLFIVVAMIFSNTCTLIFLLEKCE